MDADPWQEALNEARLRGDRERYNHLLMAGVNNAFPVGEGTLTTEKRYQRTVAYWVRGAAAQAAFDWLITHA